MPPVNMSVTESTFKIRINVAFKIAYVCVCAERITQNVVKSHVETCRYSAEELKRLTWNLYTPEETRSFQLKVITKSSLSVINMFHAVTVKPIPFRVRGWSLRIKVMRPGILVTVISC